jgi:hypothetical protein
MFATVLQRGRNPLMHFALGALDAEHVEPAFDVAEDEIGSGIYLGV